MKSKSLGAVHTHTRHSTKRNGNYLLDEPQFSKINRYENKGMELAFICDKLKDRSKL